MTTTELTGSTTPMSSTIRNTEKNNPYLEYLDTPDNPDPILDDLGGYMDAR